MGFDLKWLVDAGKGAVKDIARDTVRGGTKALTKEVVSHTKRVTLLQAKKGIAGIKSLTGPATYRGYDHPKWFTDILTNRAGSVIPVIGMRHTGKTTFCVAEAEIIQQSTHCAIIFPGYPPEKAPENIIAVPEEKIHELMHGIPPGTVIILDDASRFINSKRTMSDRGIEFENWINAMAHQGVHLFLNVQDSSDLHKASLRSDVMVFKPPERMFEGSERRAMRPLIRRAMEEFKKLPKSQWVSHAWLWRSPEQCAMIKYDRPPWFDTEKAKYRGDAFTIGGRQNDNRLSGSITEAGGGLLTGKKRVVDVNPFGDEDTLLI